MFDKFAEDARTILVGAQRHAYRLGHEYTGSEHILLALLTFDTAVQPVLVAHFMSLSGVDRQVRALTKLPPPDEHPDGETADDAITVAVAAQQVPKANAERRTAPPPRRFGRRPKGAPVVGLPFTHHAKGVIERADKESLLRSDKAVRGGHLTLALLDTPECLALTIVEGSGADLAHLRAALAVTLQPTPLLSQPDPDPTE